ncbi:MAG: methylmalonyl-CoA epimerase [Anaerolineae bacterium]|jgi:methylmalonyl-CoA/ethylmalonyl-CoA epimerase
MKVTRIDHVAIAVEDIDEALTFYRDALGLEVTTTDIEEGQGVVVAFMPVGDSELELIEPVDKGSGVARFLDKRGPGQHHICLEVDDLDAAMARLRAHDVELIDDEPYVGTGGRRIAFVHPRSSYGVLIELYETLPGDHLRRRLEDVGELRRRLLVRGRVAAAGTRGFLGGLRGRGDEEPE